MHSCRKGMCTGTNIMHIQLGHSQTGPVTAAFMFQDKLFCVSVYLLKHFKDSERSQNSLCSIASPFSDSPYTSERALTRICGQQCGQSVGV